MLRNQYTKTHVGLDKQHKTILLDIERNEKLKNCEVNAESKMQKTNLVLELKEHMEMDNIYSCVDKIKGENPCFESDKKLTDTKPVLKNLYIKKSKW